MCVHTHIYAHIYMHVHTCIYTCMETGIHKCFLQFHELSYQMIEPKQEIMGTSDL